MVTIYIDVLFAVNFIINTLIIEGTGVIISEEVKWYRSLLSALLGAVYAVMVFFPNLHFAQAFIMKIVLSQLMVLTAFKIRSKIHFLKMWGCFYLVSFVFGGTIIAIMSMSNLGAKTAAVYSNGTIYFNLPWKILFLSGAIAYFMIYIFGRIRKKKVEKQAISRNLAIYLNGEMLETKAIIDTGNSLCDPITGDPVIVCEYDEIKKIIPQCEEGNFVEKMIETGLKVRLIPFCSIGKEKGIMPAFLPDMVKIDELEVKKCVVGISENRLSQSEEYHALLNPMIVVNKIER